MARKILFVMQKITDIGLADLDIIQINIQIKSKYQKKAVRQTKTAKKIIYVLVTRT